MNKSMYILAIIAALLTTACRKDIAEPAVPKTMEELKVPANFDWKTTRDYQITFSTSQSGLVMVIGSQNAVYQRAYLSPQQAYTMKLTLPAYEKVVMVRFAGKDVRIDLTGGNINVNLK